MTDQEYDALVALARKHNRTTGDIRAICVALGVPVLRKVPPSRITWVNLALTSGLAPTTQVDRISKLVEMLFLSWDSVLKRVQELHGVGSIAHLLPTQADQVEASLQKALAARKPQPAPAA